jgi:hypothetical protein
LQVTSCLVPSPLQSGGKSEMSGDIQVVALDHYESIVRA